MPEEFTEQHIIETVRSRAKGQRHGYGVTFAARYVEQVIDCIDSGVCPAGLLGVDGSAYSKAIEEAEHTLVYCNEDMGVKSVHVKAPRSSIMAFTATITTTKRDRDGDVLEAKGADPDPRMPLLWQHISAQPIGKLVKLGTHNSKRLNGTFAIADTPLGRDAATLVDFGALRISHGFRPKKAEPLKEAKEDDEYGGRGIRFMEFEVMETSLVSVPANTDAVITAFSRGKLTHPLVKNWAGKAFDARPTKVAVDLPVTMRTFTSNDGSVAVVADFKQPQRQKTLLDDDESGGKVVVPTEQDYRTVPGNPPSGSGPGQSGTWKKPALKDFTSENWENLSPSEKSRISKFFAFAKSLPPSSFGDLKLPHHFPRSGKASLNGVRNALARLSQTQGMSAQDKQRAQAHLRAHLPRDEAELPLEYFKLFAAAAEIVAAKVDETSEPLLRRLQGVLTHALEQYDRSLEDAQWQAAAAELGIPLEV